MKFNQHFYEQKEEEKHTQSGISEFILIIVANKPGLPTSYIHDIQYTYIYWVDIITILYLYSDLGGQKINSNLNSIHTIRHETCKM